MYRLYYHNLQSVFVLYFYSFVNSSYRRQVSWSSWLRAKKWLVVPSYLLVPQALARLPLHWPLLRNSVTRYHSVPWSAVKCFPQKSRRPRCWWKTSGGLSVIECPDLLTFCFPLTRYSSEEEDIVILAVLPIIPSAPPYPPPPPPPPPPLNPPPPPQVGGGGGMAERMV